MRANKGGRKEVVAEAVIWAVGTAISSGGRIREISGGHGSSQECFRSSEADRPKRARRAGGESCRVRKDSQGYALRAFTHMRAFVQSEAGLTLSAAFGKGC